MRDFIGPIEKFLALPFVTLAVGLVLLVVGWRVSSDLAGSLVLVVAWMLLSLSIYRFIGLPTIPRMLLTMLLAGALGLALYYLDVKTVRPRTAQIPTLTQTVGATDASDATIHRAPVSSASVAEPAAGKSSHPLPQPRAETDRKPKSENQSEVRRVAAVQTNSRWTARQVASRHLAASPYAIEVTLMTTTSISNPHIEVTCDGPIDSAMLSVEPVDAAMGGPALMSSDRHNIASVYQFDVSQPVFTPDLRFKVLLESKRAIGITNVVVREPNPRVLSQTMINSPGGIQAAGNVTINRALGRILNSAEAVKLASVLRGVAGGPVSIHCSEAAGAEPCDLADQLAGILRGVGWATEVQRFPNLMMAGITQPIGISLVVHAPDTSGGAVLQEALTPFYGVIPAGVNPKLPTPITITILAGRRPEPSGSL
ncbi:MAG: hypothetical protein QOK37_3989 [Thermoanaerobaculia bacterium]|jgi:hypothetical protein|nr:hypothetical protein [Thermoanaerobaculia bacterium]